MSRRAFMGGAATTAFSVMAARTALGSEANSRVTAGVIGLGGRGTMIATMVQEHGGYRIEALADYFAEVVDPAGERFGVPAARRFTGLEGYRGLLDAGVDAVFLETPPYCFPEHAGAAVDAGCHVYIAKPLGCDVPGCMAIRDAAQRARARERVFLVDFQTRTDPLYIEAIGRIRNGDYGEIGLLDALYAGEGFDDPPLTDTIESRLRDLVWVNDIALGGGYFVNAGIHAVDVALWVAGERPLSAVGHSRRARPAPHGDAPDVHSMTFEFPGGLALAYRGEHLRNRHGFSSDCMAYCQRGALTTQYAGHVRIDAHEDAYAGGPVEALYTAGAQRNIDTFHRQVVEGDVSQPTVGPAVDATIATILGRDAAARGTRLTWDEVVKENRRVEPNLSGLRA